MGFTEKIIIGPHKLENIEVLNWNKQKILGSKTNQKKIEK